MQGFTGRSWRVTFDPTPMLLHAALWVRDVSGVTVDDDLTPPPLLQPPTRRQLELPIEPDQWLTWWHHLLRERTIARDLPWHLAPQPMLPALEALGDEPLRWASRSVRDRSRFGPPEYQLPVGEAVRELERSSNAPFRASVRVVGLAVEGYWTQLDHRSETILASWEALEAVRVWLPSALRGLADAGSLP